MADGNSSSDSESKEGIEINVRTGPSRTDHGPRFVLSLSPPRPAMTGNGREPKCRRKLRRIYRSLVGPRPHQPTPSNATTTTLPRNSENARIK